MFNCREKDRKFFFGKYKGRYIKDIIVSDTQYITWSMKNVTWFWFNAEEVDLYKKQILKDGVKRNQYDIIMESLENERVG